MVNGKTRQWRRHHPSAEAEVREGSEAGGAQVGQDVVMAGGGDVVSAAGPVG